MAKKTKVYISYGLISKMQLFSSQEDMYSGIAAPVGSFEVEIPDHLDLSEEEVEEAVRSHKDVLNMIELRKAQKMIDRANIVMEDDK
jgi:hypothetical protein